MKQVSNDYKTKIKEYGRQLDSIITYTENGQSKTLGGNQLNAITPSFESSILKSVMKELVIDSNVDIPLETEINYQFGVMTDEINGTYEYIDFGNYIVYKSEKKEDTESYQITCYDKMLYAMKPYESLEVNYPITIRNYITALCTKLGLTFANSSDTFANYDKEIQNELYLNDEGNDIGYTYRDVLDEIAQATASIICINSDDELEIRYIPSAEPIEPSKNLLNETLGFVNGYISSINVFTPDPKTALYNQYIQVESGETYTFSTNARVDNMVISMYNSSDTFLGRQKVSNTTKLTQTMGNNVAYVRYAINYNNSATMTKTILDSLQVMVEKSSNRTEPYEPYIEPIPEAETIDERSFKDTNVNFGEKYGPVNSIVLSRADSDNVYLQDEESVEQNGLCEIKIIDNQIMNGNDRDEYLQDILDTLDGLEYYTNDYVSTGITYLELCDRYNAQIGEKTYPCIMFNDEILVTQGLEENIHANMPKDSETDYTKADKTDRRINQTTLIVDKHEQEINALISKVVDLSDTEENTGSVTLENAHAGILHKLEIRGNISLVYPNNESQYGQPVIISDDLVVSNDQYISGGIPYIEQDPIYPSTGLYPKDSYLQVDETLYKLDFDYLNYINETTYDKYVYEEGKQWIERNVGIDPEGNMYPLSNTIIEEKPDIYIEIENNSTLTLLSHMNGILKVEYLLENQYTDTFATQAYVNSEITQTVDSIEQKVSSVSDTEGNITSASIKLAINKDESEIKLKGDQISLEGTITANEGFMIDTNGNMTCNNGTFNGGNIELYGDKNDDTLFRVNDNNSRWCYVLPAGVSASRRIDENNILTCGFSTYVNDPYSSDITYTHIGSSIDHYEGGTGTTIGLWELFTVEEYCTFNLMAEGINKIIMTSSDGTIQASAFVNTSTEEKKKDIKKLEKALDKIKETDICEYNWESEKKSSQKHYGLVIGDKYNTPKEFIYKDKEGNEKGIDIYSTLAFCIKAIQEQQEQIEELKKEIELLKEEKNGKNKLSK